MEVNSSKQINKVKKKDLLLYAVTDRTWLKGRTLSEVVEASLKGGATFLQLREKGLDKATFYQEARELKALSSQYQVPFVINDNVDIANQIDCDGVHLGQSDMTLSQARKILGSQKIIGVSVETVKQAIIAEQNGADYLGVGSVFATRTKLDAADVSLETVKAICEAVSIPVVAIGGINKSNIALLEGTKIDGIAVISALYDSAQIERSTRELLELSKVMVNR